MGVEVTYQAGISRGGQGGTPGQSVPGGLQEEWEDCPQHA